MCQFIALILASSFSGNWTSGSFVCFKKKRNTFIDLPAGKFASTYFVINKICAKIHQLPLHIQKTPTINSATLGWLRCFWPGHFRHRLAISGTQKHARSHMNALIALDCVYSPRFLSSSLAVTLCYFVRSVALCSNLGNKNKANHWPWRQAAALLSVWREHDSVIRTLYTSVCEQ